MSEQTEVIEIDQGDVTVERLDWVRCPCCGKRKQTHAVWIEWRDNGSKHAAFQGCQRCCEAFAERLRAALPAEA